MAEDRITIRIPDEDEPRRGPIIQLPESEEGVFEYTLTGFEDEDFERLLNNTTTDELAEGSSNLYYTDVRVSNAPFITSLDSRVTSLENETLPSSVIQDGDNISRLTNDTGYLTSVPTRFIEENENISLLNNDVGYITSIPSSFIENGDNVSLLNNDAGYISSIPVTYLEDGDDLSRLNNDVGYLTSISGFTTDDLTEGVSNLYYETERLQDDVAAFVEGGNGISISYQDSAGTLTIDNTFTLTVPGSDTNILFNDGGSLGASPNFTFDGRNTKIDVAPASANLAPSYTIIHDGGSALNVLAGSGGGIFQVDDNSNFQIGFNSQFNIESSDTNGFDSKLLIQPTRTTITTDLQIDQNTDASTLLVKYDGNNRFFVQDNRTGVVGKLQVDAQVGQTDPLFVLNDETGETRLSLTNDGLNFGIDATDFSSQKYRWGLYNVNNNFREQTIDLKLGGDTLIESTRIDLRLKAQREIEFRDFINDDLWVKVDTNGLIVNRQLNVNAIVGQTDPVFLINDSTSTSVFEVDASGNYVGDFVILPNDDGAPQTVFDILSRDNQQSELRLRYPQGFGTPRLEFNDNIQSYIQETSSSLKVNAFQEVTISSNNYSFLVNNDAVVSNGPTIINSGIGQTEPILRMEDANNSALLTIEPDGIIQSGGGQRMFDLTGSEIRPYQNIYPNGDTNISLGRAINRFKNIYGRQIYASVNAGEITNGFYAFQVADTSFNVQFAIDVDGTLLPDGSTQAVSGTFTDNAGNTITVTNGVITSLS